MVGNFAYMTVKGGVIKVKTSVKYMEETKWKHLDLKECIGKSIAKLMSKDARVMVAALLDDDNKPQFFLTNNKEQYEIYTKKAFTLMVDDLLLLLGSETIPDVPLARAILESFPNATFEVKEDMRREEGFVPKKNQYLGQDGKWRTIK